MKQKKQKTKKAGFVALLGRTNAGKSTFLNQVLERKVAIVSDRAQTTRKRILGVYNDQRGQIIFFDAPGIHKPYFKLNEIMMQEVKKSLQDADLILYFLEIDDQRIDKEALTLIADYKKPVFLVINKIDKYSKSRALEAIDHFKDAYQWKEIVPVSALFGANLDHLLKLIFDYLPEGEPFYSEDTVTQLTEEEYCQELIREKILNQVFDELPFVVAVKVEELKRKEKIVVLRAEIYVETQSQKKL